MTEACRLRRFLLPTDLEEAFCAELWSCGTQGLEIKIRGEEIQVDAYFPPQEDPAERSLVLPPWESRGLRAFPEEVIPERDWLAEYRASASPLPLGRGFLVDPRDPPLERPGSRSAEGRLILSIPARNAFGTGSHESTRLAVEWLEEVALDQARVLDVGSGSGILSFVALELGAGSVTGLDLDTPSVISARANALANGSRPSFFAGRLGSLAAKGRFDLALVNILPERILGEIPLLLPLLSPSARLISSGNLRSRGQELLRRFASLGLRSLGEKREKDWVAFLLTQGPGS